MSNSKLTPKQNSSRKDLKLDLFAQNGQILQNAENGRTMVVYPEFRGSRMVRVTFSHMSPNEQKFRRKVGEYHALIALYTGMYVTMPSNTDFRALMDI